MHSNSLQPFYTALMEFIALSKQQMFKIAAEFELTSPQVLLLLLAARDEKRTMHSYCDMLGCDASNITGIVDGLERKGLVKRAEHPTDRRIKMLQLQPKGAEIRAAILEQLSDRNQSFILSKLSNEEVEQFTSLIRKITADCPRGQA
jgi:DNA-binding MarR family transcriptional regulator